jgi:hypothetical protein
LTKDLRTPKDVAETRLKLLLEQDNKDACLGIPISKGACLDHAHDDTQFVRAVLHREINAFIGKIENSHIRHIKYWYKEEDLPSILRKIADYLSREHDKRYRHPDWIKKVKVIFNKLNAQQQRDFLEKFGVILQNNNQEQRKAIFSDIIRAYSFNDIVKQFERN